MQVQTRAAITSDHPDFQRCINQIAGHHIEAVSSINVDTVFQFLIVVHADESAETYVNEIPVVADVYGRGAIQAGQILRDSDVANIKALRFANVRVVPTDKVIYRFKVRWKFALFFDLSRQLDAQHMSRLLAHLYRTLRFEAAYKNLRSADSFAPLLRDGWFPFVELLPRDYETLTLAYQADLARAGMIEEVLASFTPERSWRISATCSSQALTLLWITLPFLDIASRMA